MYWFRNHECFRCWRITAFVVVDPIGTRNTDNWGKNDTTPKRLTPFLPLLKNGGALSSCSNYQNFTAGSYTISQSAYGEK